MSWYKKEKKEVLKQLNTSLSGLSLQEAEKRLQVFGPNEIEKSETINLFKLVIEQVKSPLIYILIVAGIVTFSLGHFIDGIVIFSVIILNGLIGFIQEYKAAKSVLDLQKLVNVESTVLREGQKISLDSKALVPGDIVVLSSGDKVPADIRLLESKSLYADESILTGESLPSLKESEFTANSRLPLAEQKNMLFMGTWITKGRGLGVVVETGANTVLGNIAAKTKASQLTKIPIQQKIDSLGNRLGLLVLGSALLITIAGHLKEIPLTEIFLTAVAAAVATIPEGLPIVVTIALAIGVNRMARQNAIIRTLPTVETLGSTTVICSDKTGTLTKNQMTTKLIFDGQHTYEVEGSGYEPKGRILHEKMPLKPEEETRVKNILRIGLLCNESRLIFQDNSYQVQGDPTEGALLIAALKAGLLLEEEQKKYPLLDILPFESERGYMATLHQGEEKNILLLKGGLEHLLKICTNCLLEESFPQKAFSEAEKSFASQGLRVLAFAYKELPRDVHKIRTQDLESGLIFAGLQGLIDPPREEAKQAIKELKKAGVRILMLTGDQALTAKSIGEQLELAEKNTSTLTGIELESLSPEELKQKLKETTIFARVSPEHKLQIVNLLKEQGEIVAVTGDGVNDAPALKSAHIGIAMGKSGTDVAKEAADMVILDDNFASIAYALKEGRIVFDNIRKVIFFLLPTGIAAVISILLSLLLNLPIPYLAVQLLWINLVTNGLQDIALAFEPGEKNIQYRAPRPPKEPIISSLLLQRTILVAITIGLGVIFNFYLALKQGYPLEEARSVAMTTMVFFQFFQALNSRSETLSLFKLNPFNNPFLFYSLIVAFLSQLAVLYTPFLKQIFRTTSLSPNQWLIILLTSLSVILVVEMDKLIRAKLKTKQ